MTDVNRCFVLHQRPSPHITHETLRWVERPVPEPAEGEVLIRNSYLSLDPANRGWMNERASYVPAIPLGEVMRGATVGRVVKSRAPDFAEGDLVAGRGGYAEYSALPAEELRAVPPGLEPRDILGPLGHIGLTAYFGLLDIGKPKQGETVVVSGAAGATGSLVVQIAKLKGCRVVGTAGSDAKCSYLTGELGCDVAINYKTTESLVAALGQSCPEGIDVFFDNVGGDVLDAALANIAMRARIVLCGGISQYNTDTPKGPANYLALVIKRASMQGFIVMDYLPRASEAMAEIVPWMRSGKLTFRYDVVEGLEHAAEALLRLFDGRNEGKLIVKIAD